MSIDSETKNEKSIHKKSIKMKLKVKAFKIYYWGGDLKKKLNSDRFILDWDEFTYKKIVQAAKII